MSTTISRSTTAFYVTAVLPIALTAAGFAELPAIDGDGPADCPASGDTCADGTIYAGLSPDTGRNMFVTPKDASGVLKWQAAMKYAADFDAHGHNDWRLPSRAELDILYLNRNKGALKGTFDESGSLIAGWSLMAGWYWSSTEHPDFADLAWMERFSDGYRSWISKDDGIRILGWEYSGASVRPVRSEPAAP